MGWWNTNSDGKSLVTEDTGLIWGDEVADVLDEAITRIYDIFLRTMGRPPSKDELLAGMRFSAGATPPHRWQPAAK
jgi:hypothetical protein